jgi:hypothetical protein
MVRRVDGIIKVLPETIYKCTEGGKCYPLGGRGTESPQSNIPGFTAIPV